MKALFVLSLPVSTDLHRTVFFFSPLKTKPLDSIMDLDRSKTKSPKELTAIWYDVYFTPLSSKASLMSFRFADGFILAKAILSSSVAPRLSGDNPSLRGSSDETESSLSVARRRKDDSLSLRGSSRKRSQTSLSLSLADGEEGNRRLSRSLWVSSSAKDRSLSLGGYTGIGRFDSFSRWLSSMAIYGSLSMAIYGSLSVALLHGDGALCRCLSAIRTGKASVSCYSMMHVSDCALEQALKSMKDVSDFQLMWSIKKDDLAMKQQLSKMRLLERSQTSCEKDHKLVVESRREMRRITVTIKVVE
ncbi:hypothetical protein DY000_02008974 [Brassica cretica]|uniref:Uncharacterized protein n=1 Tax=Brassica cretica TaxID=69181 RepID=A0ABQ7CHM3_BRACR|nr:hypothetical protein DY000_02008974 [Brassica cretica]